LHHCCGVDGTGRNWSEKSPTSKRGGLNIHHCCTTIAAQAVQAVPPAMLMRLEELEEELQQLKERDGLL
jgi:hypothetical protein